MIGIGLGAMSSASLGGFHWRLVKSVQDAASSPYGYDSIDLSGAGSLATSRTASPAPYEGARYVRFTCDGSDGQNGRARGMIEPSSWSSSRKHLRATLAVQLPTGWSTSIVSNGSAQIWKFDCFPTVGYQVFLLYYQGDNTHKLVVKDNNVDTDITGTFTIAENAWVLLDIQMRLSNGTDGWARVFRNGTLVASGSGVKTIYAADNGAGNKIPYVRYGLAAHGTGQTSATQADIDAPKLYWAP